MLISPLNTFINWGNSSSFQCLKNCPERVILESAPTVSFGPRVSSSIRIVLNLKISKCCPFRPTLTCLKKIGPTESLFTAMAQRTKTGSKKKMPKKLANMSNERFKVLPSSAKIATYRFNHSRLIVIRHCRKKRNADHSVIGEFCFWKLFRQNFETFSPVRMAMQRHIVHARADTIFGKMVDQIATRKALCDGIVVQTNDVKMPRMLVGFPALAWKYKRQIRK